MKTKKLIFLFSILFSMLATNVSAKDTYDIAVKNADGVMIYYNYYYNDNTKVCVTHKTDSYNSYSGGVVIPKEITYNKKKIKVTGIAFSAFYKCQNLTSVTIPNSVTSIGSFAFEDCSSLNTITIPNSMTQINGYTFQNCSSLTSVTIPNSVKGIGSGAFYGCI